MVQRQYDKVSIVNANLIGRINPLVNINTNAYNKFLGK